MSRIFAYRDSDGARLNCAMTSNRSNRRSQWRCVFIRKSRRKRSAAPRFSSGLAHNAPLRILDAVTRAMPANAWARRFVWNGQTVQVAGYRQGPADLLVKFESSPVLRNARALSTNAKPAAPNTPEAFEIAADIARPLVKR
jgi:hypothetical protein